MAKKVELKERGTNEVMYPVTSIDCVVGADTVVSKVTELDTKATELDTRVDALELKDKIKFFEEHNTKVHYIIDQRGTISDPDTMVSENFVFDDEGNKVFIPEELKRNPSANCLAWLRANSHAYVTHFVSDVLRIKQLDDTTRKKFADGTSSVSYISDEANDYDVMMKIDSDVYWKTEAYTPDGETEPDEDYVLVTIARELGPDDNEADWEKWSKHNLIGVYESFEANGKLYSLSNKRPTVDTPTNMPTMLSKVTAKGNNFNGFTYTAHQLMVFLFYGYYSSLDCQTICGAGTRISDNNSDYNYKITGITDNLAMTDTDDITGNGTATQSSTQIKEGIGSDIKSVNFWSLENLWGDCVECITNVRIMQVDKPSDTSTVDETLYISDYLDNYSNIVITDKGIDTIYTSKADFIAAYPTKAFTFIAITDINGNIIRAIKSKVDNDRINIPQKLIFGKHADIFAKMIYTNGVAYNYKFSDNQFGTRTRDGGTFCTRSGIADWYDGGINYIGFGGSYNVNLRFIYEGTADTIQLITNPMEEL